MSRAAAAFVALGALIAGLWPRRANAAVQPAGPLDVAAQNLGEAIRDALPDFAPQQLPQAEPPASDDTIVRVVAAGAGWTEVAYRDGRIVRRTGVRAWRNNNPGNIEAGSYANSQGAVGTDGRFAVFPTFAHGRRAKERLIFEAGAYRNLSLADAIARYAPPSENNTAFYLAQVAAAVGGSIRRMADYSAAERVAIMDAMERVEGYRVGSVQTVGSAIA